MKKEILDYLEQLATEKNIDILMAVESGSRAWGCASPDSDYDVRIIFKRPLNDYLKINEPTDHLDYFHGALLDINGWDLRKALGLVRKSNATPFEWVQSPILYQEQPGFREELLALCRAYFQPYHALNHYKGIAKNSYESAVVGQPFKLKKLFYVIRPLLAATWIIKNKTVPPMDLPNLMVLIEGKGIHHRILELLEVKAGVSESYQYTLESDIHQFVKELFDFVDGAVLERPGPLKPADSLNDAFRKQINA